MSRLNSGLAIAALVLLLASLWLMSNATQGSARFDRLYSVLLFINVAGLLTLALLIGHNLYRLLRQMRERQAGARLTGRITALFVALAVTPVIVVYAFSFQFLSRGIDTWFDVRIEQALDDALDLGRASLDARMRDLLQRTRQLAADLAETRRGEIALRLEDERLAADGERALHRALLGIHEPEPACATREGSPTSRVVTRRISRRWTVSSNGRARCMVARLSQITKSPVRHECRYTSSGRVACSMRSRRSSRPSGSGRSRIREAWEAR